MNIRLTEWRLNPIPSTPYCGFCDVEIKSGGDFVCLLGVKVIQYGGGALKIKFPTIRRNDAETGEPVFFATVSLSLPLKVEVEKLIKEEWGKMRRDFFAG